MGSVSPLTAIPALLVRARQDADAALAAARTRAHASGPEVNTAPNTIAHGDNLALLADLVVTAERSDTQRPAFVYLDPPYASAADYRSRIHTRLVDGTNLAFEHVAYRDRWDGGVTDYLAMLAPRLMLVHALLRADGAVCVHVDWHAAHWVRVLLDEVFGAEHFVNSIVWSYRSGGASRTTAVPRKHDNLLVYRRSRAFRVRGQRERQYLDKPFMGSRQDAAGRHYVDTILRDVLEGELTLVDDAGTLTTTSVRPVLNMAGDRTGYPTQKPQGLLEILLRWFTDPGDLVVDPVAGSGTTAVAAHALDRSWWGCDASAQAVAVQRARMDALGADYRLVTNDDGAVPQPHASELRVETNRIPGHTSLLAAPASPQLLAALRPARGQSTDALARLERDPLAAVAGWVCWHHDQRLAAAWRDAKGHLPTTITTDKGATITHIEVIDLIGARRCVALAASG